MSRKCIRKEAIEETGFEVGTVQKVFELFMSRRGHRADPLLHCGIYRCPAHAPGGGVDDEDIEVLEMPFAKAVDMVKRGEIRDGKAVILLQYLQTSGLMNAAAEAR